MVSTDQRTHQIFINQTDEAEGARVLIAATAESHGLGLVALNAATFVVGSITLENRTPIRPRHAVTAGSLAENTFCVTRQTTGGNDGGKLLQMPTSRRAAILPRRISRHVTLYKLGVLRHCRIFLVHDEHLLKPNPAWCRAIVGR